MCVVRRFVSRSCTHTTLLCTCMQTYTKHTCTQTDILAVRIHRNARPTNTHYASSTPVYTYVLYTLRYTRVRYAHDICTTITTVSTHTHTPPRRRHTQHALIPCSAVMCDGLTRHTQQRALPLTLHVHHRLVLSLSHLHSARLCCRLANYLICCALRECGRFRQRTLPFLEVTGRRFF